MSLSTSNNNNISSSSTSGASGLPPLAEAIELQKQEFKKYLEDHGVLQQLSRVLVGLYEEPDRPKNALDFIKKHLGAPTGVDIEALRSEVETLKKENAFLKSRVEQLQEELDTIKQELDG